MPNRRHRPAMTSSTFLPALIAVLALFAVSLGHSSSADAAGVAITEATICLTVSDRDPACQLTPTEPDGTVIVESASVRSVAFWTRVVCDAPTTVVHTWYRLDPAPASGEPEPPLSPEQEAARIELKVMPSEGFRTWSTIQIVPGSDHGLWKVTVTTSDDPDTVLAEKNFLVN